MDLGGGEIGGAVQRQQVMAVQIDEAFEHLAALQRRKTSRNGARRFAGSRGSRMSRI